LSGPFAEFLKPFFAILWINKMACIN